MTIQECYHELGGDYQSVKQLMQSDARVGKICAPFFAGYQF